MFSKVGLPLELTNIASGLEERFRVLRVPSRKVQWDEWESLPAGIHDFIPNWIPTMLSSFSLVGGVLECSNFEGAVEDRRLFSFMDPPEYRRTLYEGNGILKEETLAKGFTPISYEQNGNVWVTGIRGGVDSPIYLFSLSDMENIFASSRIELLMASMAVSELSFPERMAKTSVMWCPEK